MKAVMVREWSEPQNFFIEDIAIPTPGPGEILASVHTAAVNFGDTLIATGRYQVKPRLPFIPGSECSGVVEAVGTGVTAFAPGDRIAACGFIGDSRLDRHILGTFAEYIVMPSANAVRLPDGVSLADAALFRSNTETSYHALQVGRLRAGETLLVLGAGGGVGFAAVQLGKMIGARVIASASAQDKRDIALAGGADAAIDSYDPDWRARVREVTNGRGIDVVYDPIGGDATERAFRSLAWGGRLLVVGFAAGRIPALPANLPLLKGASLVGVNLLEAQRFEPEKTANNSRELMELFASGKLKVPPIGRSYPLAEALQAIKAVAEGEVAGRVVIDIAQKVSY